MAATRLATSARPAPGRARPVLEVQDLRAWYQMRYFGIVREVRAVDDISLEIRANEIYGLAGEFELRQDHLDQDDRGRDPAAAQRAGRRRPLPLQGPGAQRLRGEARRAR